MKTAFSPLAALPLLLLFASVSSASDRLEERLAALEERRDSGVSVGGALRYQYAWRDWVDASDHRGGDLEFDTFILNIDGQHDGLILSAEYRFYRSWNALKKGWVGYDFSDQTQVRLGLDQVPFGITPFSSNSFFFSSNYYLGLEDNYKAGISVDHRIGDWFLQGGFYKNAGFGAGGGNASDAGRYSYDLITSADCAVAAEEQCNEAINQLSLRLARQVAGIEFGVSAQGGELYNQSTEEVGDFWAGAVHMNVGAGNWGGMLQATRYGYNPENPASISTDTVQIGAYDYTELMAARANTWLAHLSYSQDVNWGPTSNLLWYLNSNLVTDKSGDFEDTQMYIAGVAVTTGNLYTMVDIVRAQNQPFIGGTTASMEDDWNTRFNVNFGYYF